MNVSLVQNKNEYTSLNFTLLQITQDSFKVHNSFFVNK